MSVELTWAEWIGDILSERRWSQEELAERAGISQSAVSGWFTKGSRPNRITCAAIARALNLPHGVVFRAAGYIPPAAQPSPPPRSEQEVQYRATGEDSPSYDADPLADPRLRFLASVEGDLPPGDVEFLREMAQALRERRKREADGVSD